MNTDKKNDNGVLGGIVWLLSNYLFDRENIYTMKHRDVFYCNNLNGIFSFCNFFDKGLSKVMNGKFSFLAMEANTASP